MEISKVLLPLSGKVRKGLIAAINAAYTSEHIFMHGAAFYVGKRCVSASNSDRVYNIRYGLNYGILHGKYCLGHAEMAVVHQLTVRGRAKQWREKDYSLRDYVCSSIGEGQKRPICS